jgi:hypothetical protein
MSEIKFSVRKGAMEISYEGTEEYLYDKFFGIVDRILALPDFAGLPTPDAPQSDSAGQSYEMSMDANQRAVPQMSINNLCARLNCQTGPDLVLAACAYLTFIQGQDTFTRKDIATTMRDATRYFKDTFASNLTAYLQTLVKNGKLMERRDEVYVLTPTYAAELEAALVQ